MLRNDFLQAQAAARLTHRQRLPDVSVGVAARNYTGDGSLRQGMLLLGMNLPWGNAAKYRSDIARDEAKAEAARFEFLDYELTVREQIHKLALAIDVSRREALLYHDQIIPRSDAALASLRASWEAGRAMLSDVLEARRMVLDGQAMYAQAIADQYSSLADLVQFCGLSGIDKLLEVGVPPAPSTSPQP
jgi:outer membrane protein TolC